MSMEKKIQVPESVLRNAIACIARAEIEGAFRGCVVPRIGETTLAALESCLSEKGE